MRHGEAALESALRQVDRAIYESEIERQVQPTSNPAVRKFCITTIDIVNRAAPILRRGGAPAQKARAGMTTFFYDSLEKWGSRMRSLSPTDRVLLRKCLKQILSVIEPDPPPMKW